MCIIAYPCIIYERKAAELFRMSAGILDAVLAAQWRCGMKTYGRKLKAERIRAEQSNAISMS